MKKKIEIYVENRYGKVIKKSTYNSTKDAVLAIEALKNYYFDDVSIIVVDKTNYKNNDCDNR